MSTDTRLDVLGLRVAFPHAQGETVAVRDVSFSLGRERLGIVGESGSGKSTTGRALMGLVAAPGRVSAKRLSLGQVDLRGLTERGWRALRGKRIAMILQDPKYALDPTMTVGRQIAEAHRAHIREGRGAAREAALGMLEAVRIRNPARVYDLYPHEVSGGMGQRVMIAMMLVGRPDILIADEPTSALDVTVQVQFLALLDSVVRERGMGLVLISHNVPLVASFCDRILVMYAGRVVEECRAADIDAARHPYTRGLLAAVPSLRHRRQVLPQLQRDPAWLAA